MKKEIYHIFVEGIPKPQPRTRKGKHGNFYNPGTATSWKNTIQAYFLQNRQPVIMGAVYLTLHFYFKKTGIKKTTPHTQKPDKDNLEKAVMDALTSIGIWKDDCQVYDGRTAKYWSGDKSGVEIWVKEVNEMQEGEV
jgi:Holliday junction resolvase RusA-like endonuclease